RGISKNWVMERTGIGKTAFYNMLNGKGEIEEHVQKINQLFGIRDRFYFYSAEKNFEKKINHLDKKGNY
ncbi:hypothetical protein, partial [Streptococcus sobrinus]|uniref:hypothetical protein n=1 Tax=Streptococcus sobrinus TaxID=1310 RepID=UPI00036C0D6D